MNSKKVSQALFLSSILIFIDALLCLLVTLLADEFYSVAFVVIDLLPEAALATFLLCLSKSQGKTFVIRSKIILLIILTVCLVEAVFELSVVIFLESPGFINTFYNLIVLSSYLAVLPFARILSHIIALVHQTVNPVFVIALLCDFTALVGFIRALLLLHLESRQTEKEPAHEAGSELSENPEAPKMMSFRQAIKVCFKNYFSFHGCASRAEYWWFQLFITAVYSLLLLPSLIASAAGLFKLSFIFQNLILVVSIVMIPPAFSAAVRRMHDTGNPGFFIAIPIAGFVNLFVSTNDESEYRSSYNLHPTRNVLGKLFLVFTCIFYLIYGLRTSKFLYSLMQLQENYIRGHYEEENDESSEGAWWQYDEGESSQK